MTNTGVHAIVAGASPIILSVASFARSHSFTPQPSCDEVIDLSVSTLDRFRWHVDDRLRHWIHQHRFSVTDFARVRRGLPVVGRRTVENDFSGKASSFVREVSIDLFASQAKVVAGDHSNLFESPQ